jgi:hypothetical protein
VERVGNGALCCFAGKTAERVASYKLQVTGCSVGEFFADSAPDEAMRRKKLGESKRTD